jgi:hypothetical protein
MTARIIVQSGLSAGTVFWIHQSVTRLGSDPSMDLCLPSPDLDPHVLTIEFRSESYRVYNRGTQPVFMAEQCLSSGQSHLWLESELLELPDGQQLAIELDDDPSPGPPSHSFEIFGNVAGEMQQEEPGSSNAKSLSRAPRSSANSFQDDLPYSPTHSQSSSKAGQLLVIAFCLILGGFLLLRHQFQANSSVAKSAPEFEQVVREALNAQQGIPKALIGQLQYAEAAAAAGNRSTAFERYSHLRDTLMATQLDVEWTPETTKEPQLILQQILLLVEHRLSRLAR